ncbi:MAG: protein-disulfide reductase DsbD [Sulfuricaulis sp.]|uniref:protein-disulfide reductase DsbD n=1 Tax=Sulfuricaulis sp. TaxID=2003553 RepID=UPI0025EAD351|nr:protein-disulfide reductase DsbD [Sulfuricaulis sp.]MCR4347797.1 protein-disulfide reductase DsbD [Sulfuricaulis sp.]
MMKSLLALLFLLLSPAHAAAPDEELLEGDQAFRLTTRTLNATTLEASWKIAPGYYMYRDKFKFETLDGTQLKNPVFPRGKKKQDPLFGEVETYTKAVKIRLPFTRAEGTNTARLRITSQGCNEPVGVCYPPIIKEVDFKLPPGKTKPVSSTTPATVITDKISSLKDLTRRLAPIGGEQEPVDPEQAFQVSVMAHDNATLLARIDIDECCYLYRDKTKFELVTADGAPISDVRLGNITLPPGKTKNDEFIGKTEVYEKDFEVTLPVTGLGAVDRNMQLKLTYQGCSEKGVAICYPPTTKTYDVQFRGGVLSVAGTSILSHSIPGNADSRDMSKFVIAVLAAFGAGLLLTFTPCVLPMVPILSGIIVGTEGTQITKLRGGLLSYTYVLGTALTYAVAGGVAGATGDQLQAYFQTPSAIGIFAGLLVLLSLSMFGFYQLQVPSSIQSLLHHHSARMHGHVKQWFGGELIGAFILGLISALIIGACVSPILVSVLGAAIAAKDPLLGASIMFSLAHGQGAILVALGIGAGFLLPKLGKWMDSVKHFFGALLIAVAIYLLGYLPQVPVLFLWAAFFIVSGVYLGATQSLPEHASGWRYLWKGSGTFLLIWGILAFLGGFAGNRDVLNPLPLSSFSSGVMPGASAPAEEHLFVRVSNLSDLESRLAAAKTAGKPVIVDYYADWCTDCLRMEKATFADPRVRAELRQRFVMLQIDVTDPNHPDGKAIKQRFGVYGPPAMLFFSANGQERRELRTYGFRNVDEFFALLRQV